MTAVRLLIGRKRALGLSREMFVERALGAWAEQVLMLPGVVAYAQSHTLPQAYAKGEPRLDMVDEISWAGRSALAVAGGMLSAPDLFDVDLSLTLAAETHVVKPGEASPQMPKSFQFIRRRADLSFRQFSRYWRDVHSPITEGLPNLLRYEQAHAVQAPGLPPSDCDGVAIAWFMSTAEMRAAAALPAYEQLRTDETNFLDPAPVAYVITTERRLRG